MRIESLPSPGVLNFSQQLRAVAAKAISYGEIMAERSPSSTTLADLQTFFTACAVACQGGSLIVCVYPLDAAAGEITGSGSTGKLTMSNNDMTGTYTYQGGLEAPVDYGAGPAGMLTGATIDFSTGDKTIEVGFNIDTIVGTPVGDPEITGVAAYVALYAASGIDGVRVVTSVNGSGNYTTSVVIASGGSQNVVYSNAGGASYPTDIGIGISGGVLSVFADGVPLTLSSTAIADAPMIVSFSVEEEIGVPVESAGLTTSLILRTDGTTFVRSYAGREDACGNALA